MSVEVGMDLKTLPGTGLDGKPFGLNNMYLAGTAISAEMGTLFRLLIELPERANPV